MKMLNDLLAGQVDLLLYDEHIGIRIQERARDIGQDVEITVVDEKGLAAARGTAVCNAAGTVGASRDSGKRREPTSVGEAGGGLGPDQVNRRATCRAGGRADCEENARPVVRQQLEHDWPLG